MGHLEQARGKRFEYRVVALARKNGLDARRIVLSGSTEDKLDVEVAGFRFECKYRSKGLSEIYDWLEKAKAQGGLGVFVAGSRKKVLVVLEAEDFLKMMRR